MVALAPAARLRFAKRLKEIRTQRGFERARHLAQSLGVEENRYTRYERAEVEPSLTLIEKICEKLNVTPNELMGFAEIGENSGIARPAGLAEAGSRYGGGARRSGVAEQDSLAWRLAAEATALQLEHGGSKGQADPLKQMQNTSAMFRRLQTDPFGTVSEILAEPALAEVGASRKAALAELIEAFTASMS